MGRKGKAHGAFTAEEEEEKHQPYRSDLEPNRYSPLLRGRAEVEIDYRKDR